jgi:hypothetical protein
MATHTNHSGILTAVKRGALLLLGLMVGAMSPAFAAGVNPNFTSAVTGFERLEFRSNGDNTSWSIGLGSNTQSAGMFDQAGFDWADDTYYDFTYAIDSSGNASFSLFNLGSNTALQTLTWTGMTLGTTLEIHAKRGVDVEFAGESTSGDVSNAFGVDYDYVAIDPINGFDLDGSIKFRSPIGNQSTSGVTITVGNVPIPAAVWLFSSGLLGLVGMARRKKA